jgi:hypothetical protein
MKTGALAASITTAATVAPQTPIADGAAIPHLELTLVPREVSKARTPECAELTTKIGDTGTALQKPALVGVALERASAEDANARSDMAVKTAC